MIYRSAITLVIKLEVRKLAVAQPGVGLRVYNPPPRNFSEAAVLLHVDTHDDIYCIDITPPKFFFLVAPLEVRNLHVGT